MVTKTFKEYYQDPTYRERHLSYVKQRVPCSCGASVMRCNMTNHKKTKKHTEKMKQIRKENRISYNNRIDKLVQKYTDKKLSSVELADKITEAKMRYKIV